MADQTFEVTVSETDLEKLVRLLARVAQECQRTRIAGDEPRYWALGFSLKLAHHATSALTLLREGSSLDGKTTRMLDRTSLCVLARAGWEAFLLFHHVFIDPPSEVARELRLLRWSIESPRARQRYEALFPGQAEQLAAEDREIEAVEDRIRANPVFLAMDTEEQNRLLSDNQHRQTGWRPGWRELGSRAGLAKLFRADHYNYLCDHAHSGWFSLAVLRGPTAPEEVRHMRESVAGTLAVAVANMIDGLWQLFPPAIGAVSQEDGDLVARWVAAGRAQGVDPEPEVPPTET